MSANITEVWPGVFVGSGRAPARDIVRDFGLERAVILSQSTWHDYWAEHQSSRLAAIDDGVAHSAGQIAQWLRDIVRAGAVTNVRIGFFCYAGLNRSATAACLWRWWYGGVDPMESARDILRVRPESFFFDYWRELLPQLTLPPVRGDATGACT